MRDLKYRSKRSEQLRVFFENYVADYNLSEPAIRRKHDHSLRVAENCRAIGQSLRSECGWNADDSDTLWELGLLHDIGRFEQWRKYQNYRDCETEDHAQLESMGVRILTEQRVLAEHPDEEVIITAIANHNRYEIEPGLNERERRFCQVIRDADKLDIVREIIQGEIMNPRTDARFSETAVKRVQRGQLLKRSELKDGDWLLSELALLNDLNFDWTRKEVLADGLVEKMADCLAERAPLERARLNDLARVLTERVRGSLTDGG